MGFIKEFKEFAVKGNVMDMAVGVIIGGAFGKIVTSLVSDVLMPLIGKMTGDITGNAATATNAYIPSVAPIVVVTFGYCEIYIKAATAARPAPIAKVMMITLFTLIPIKTAACLSSETHLIARPVFVFCVNKNKAIMIIAETIIVINVAVFIEKLPIFILSLNNIYGTLGSGPIAGIACARFSNMKLIAIAVISEVRLFPRFLTGL